MPRWVISSPIHIRRVQPAVSVITIRNSFVAVSSPTTEVPAVSWKLWNRKT